MTGATWMGIIGRIESKIKTVKKTIIALMQFFTVYLLY
jgi:hypothetical protein